MVIEDIRASPERFAVTFQIEEGPQWIIDHLEVRGVGQGNLTDLTSQLASSAGPAVLRRKCGAGSHGCAELLLRLEAFRRQPLLLLATDGDSSSCGHGVQRHRRRTTIRSRRHCIWLNDDATVFCREVHQLKNGDPLSPNRQADIQRRFYDLGIFARVDTATENPDGETELQKRPVQLR